MPSVATLARRILYGYVLALFIGFLSLIVFFWATVGENSSPTLNVIPRGAFVAGLLLGLIISDWEHRFTRKAILIRTVVALVASVLSWIVLVGLGKMSSFIDWGDDSRALWCPLVAAVASEFVLQRSTRAQLTQTQTMPSIAMLARRILYGYLVPIMLAVFIVLIMVIDHDLRGNHSETLFAIMFLAAPVGSLLGFIWSDWNRQFTPKATLKRTVIALIALLIIYLGMTSLYAFVPSKAIPLLFKNKDVVYAIVGPLVAAVASEFLFRGRTRDRSAHS
ncbi:MAG: hypothetical protein ACLQPD_18450 [Desulfomonilaceae bacterium]